MTAVPEAESRSSDSAGYPFSAVVGHDDMRLALLLNAVHPAIGGVLVRGEKGTAKSTIVRALAALLPSLRVARDCRFGCDPGSADDCPDGPHDPAEAAVDRRANLVELPVGATEDRLVGSLDLERALTDGVRAYQPGLLASAHRGVLYVDEVNLLHDHLVDLLLDAAAMGRAHVEREGVSVSHPASFLLVGTMNPEEGELRPQLLDRFGLTVQVSASREVAERTEVVRRRLAYEADPPGFAKQWLDEDARLAGRIATARDLLPSVRLPDSELRRITALCASFEVDGMRADIVLARTAVAHAAWRRATDVAQEATATEVAGEATATEVAGETTATEVAGETTATDVAGGVALDVVEEDVATAARLVLPHRRRRDPFDEPGVEEQQLQEALQQAAEHANEGSDESGEAGETGEAGESGQDGGGAGEGGDDGGEPDGGPEGPDGPGGPGGGVPPESDANDSPRNGSGTSQQQSTSDGDRESDEDAEAPREKDPAAPDPAFRARLLEVPGLGEGAPGRRSRARSRSGQVVRSSAAEGNGIHLPATLAAAAPYQCSRGRGGPGLVLHRGDVRHSVREGRESNLVMFAVDASGSMAARERMSAVSGAVLSLLRDAYQRRDKVGVVTFRGEEAELVLPPTSSVDIAATRMRGLRTGGRTPLAEGLLRTHRALATERLRDPRRRPLLVLLTDGRATVAAARGEPEVGARRDTRRAVSDSLRAAAKLAESGVSGVVVDCESGMVRLGLADRVATALQAPCLRLAELSAENVAGVVRATRPGGGATRAA